MAIPRFTDLFRRTKENKTKAILVELRDGIKKYYEDNGVYPYNITTQDFLGTKKYFPYEKLPKVELGKYHADKNTLKLGGEIDNTGGWYYNHETGEIKINSNFLDTKDLEYSKW
jgi:hypothetical protein